MPIATWLNDERSETVTRVLNEYNCDWQRAFEAHPEWADLLGYNTKLGKKNCYNTLSRYRLRAERKLAPATDSVRARLMGRAKVPFETSPELVTAAVRKIVSEYTVDGKTHWKRAFIDHPEWRTALNIQDRRTMGRIYSQGAYLLRHDPSFLHLREKSQTNGSYEPVAAPVAPPPDPMNYCPSCGFNLMIFRTAFTVALKHSLSKQAKS